jgi:hypothetical protein
MLSVFPIIGIICVAISIYYYISKNIKLSTVFELIGNSILMVYAFYALYALYALLVLNYFIYLFFGIMFLCFLIKNILDLKKLIGDSKHV